VEEAAAASHRRLIIDRREALGKVGRALFPNDWVGGLSSMEIELIMQHGPKEDGTIKPCSPKVASRLDRALGRQLRALAQWKTAEEVLTGHADSRGGNPPEFTFGTCKRLVFNVWLRRLQPVLASARRKRGPPPDKKNRVAAKMLADIERGDTSLERLGETKLVALGLQYGVHKDTAQKALKELEDRLGNSDN
jgi:hypothetical protein